MRKILFRILMALMLFLVVLLGVSFYKDKRPLEVLRGWFGVQETVVVTPAISDSSEQEKKSDTTQQIQDLIDAQATTNAALSNDDNTTQGDIDSNASVGKTANEITTKINSLTEDDKKAIKGIVDGLITQ